MVARLLLLLALLMPVPALAQDSLEGSWALNAGGTTIFRFDLSKGEDGKWRGTWSKPSAFASDGNSFSRLSGPTKIVRSMTAIDTENGIELSFDDPAPGAVPDIFDFKPIDSDAIEMTYVGTDLAPYTLERVRPGAPLGPWDSRKIYSRASVADSPKIEPEQVLADPSRADTPKDKAPPSEAPPAPDAGSFRLKPGAPVGR